MNSNFTKKLFSDTIWLGVGLVASRGSILVSGIIVARTLGTETYGLLGIVKTSISLFYALIGLAIGTAATKHIAENKKSSNKNLGDMVGSMMIISCIIGALSAVILYMSAEMISNKILNRPELLTLLRMASAAILFSTINGTQIGILSGLNKFKETGVLNVISGAVTLPALILGAKFFALEGYVVAYTICLLCSVIMMNIIITKSIKPARIQFSIGAIKNNINRQLETSGALIVCGLMTSITNWICNVVLARSENGWLEMGIYHVANQWYSVVIFIPAILGSALLPKLSYENATSGLQGARSATFGVFKINILFAIIVSAILYMATPLIAALYGDIFSQTGYGSLYMTWVCAGLLILKSPLDQYLLALDQKTVLIYLAAILNITFLIGSVMLVNKGSAGIISARALGYGISLLTAFVFLFVIRNSK